MVMIVSPLRSFDLMNTDLNPGHPCGVNSCFAERAACNDGLTLLGSAHINVLDASSDKFVEYLTKGGALSPSAICFN